jgi:hypothetical protein
LGASADFGLGNIADPGKSGEARDARSIAHAPSPEKPIEGLELPSKTCEFDHRALLPTMSAPTGPAMERWSMRKS